VKHEAYVHEAAKLAGKAANGSYPVVIITEGTGSTGVYGPELMRDDQAQLFENAASFMDHPVDPQKPYLRSVMSIGGRIRNVRAGVSEGKRALLGDYFPRKEYAEFVEEFADTLGLSIFSLAQGSERDEHDRLIVESFSPIDPYRSVDVVVAAGAGGKFERAHESARAIESSLGKPAGTQPGSTPAPGTNQEVRMEKEDIDAIAAAVVEAFKPVVTLLQEQKTAIEALKPGAAAPDAPKETKDIIKGAVESLKLIEDAKIASPTLKASLVESVSRGEDITQSLEFAKKVTAEAATPGVTKVDPVTATDTYVQEAAASTGRHDFTIGRLASGV
jgi:hypothetical protein